MNYTSLSLLPQELSEPLTNLPGQLPGLPVQLQDLPTTLPISSVSYSPRVFPIDPAPVSSLWFLLASVPDYRRTQGKRHPLPVVLVLAILAKCCGHQSYQAMAEWAENYQDILEEQVPFIAGHTPDASTFHRVFSKLDIDAFEAALSEWIKTISPPNVGEGIAIDGKSVRGTGLHLVSAFAHLASSVLFQKGTDTKGKELVIGPEVIKQIPIAGMIVTADALFAQRGFCQDITDRGGGYAITVKDNQRALRENISLFFSDPPFDAEITTTANTGKSKGRLEKRTVEVSSDPSLISYLNWPGLTHVWRCTREVTRNGKPTTEVVVGIARLLQGEREGREEAAKQLAALIRGHWLIENRLHWQRDVVFGEDKSTIRKNNAPQVMAAICNLIITIFNRAMVKSFPAAFRRFAAKPEELFAFFGLTRAGYTQQYEYARAYAR